MLELREIRKTYRIGEIETKALDGISVAFRQKEFVAILGTSGSGKTTCLNIIGGLDRYDSGDLIIKGKHTRDFREDDWDAYRNNSIGFVFQNYNLIPHLSIVANVELGMTLSGISSDEKRRRAVDVLTQVGLKNHLHKKPNQLSGGEMQRVAIARALANDPEILLCDEPTGALDTVTSTQIMDLIHEVARDRLVIMVTHNPLIAEKYADRIIRFQDGRIIADSHPHQERPKPDGFKLVKTSMRFVTALRLSANNLRMKKGRTFLTAFASSIGIIGIAVIISLSSGFDKKIDEFQADAMAEFPIIISQNAATMDTERLQDMRDTFRATGTEAYADTDAVYLYDPSETTVMHVNLLTDEYIEYLEAIDPAICSSIGYMRLVGMNLVRVTEEGAVPASINSLLTSMGGGSMSSLSSMTTAAGMSAMGLSTYPEPLDPSAPSYLERHYDLLAGEYPQGATDLVLVVDRKNRVDLSVLKKLGFETEGIERIDFSDIVGTELLLVENDDYYAKTGFGTYLPGMNYQKMAEAENNVKLRISGVVRQMESNRTGLLSVGVAYSDSLVKLVLERAADSEIVQAQASSNKSVFTLEDMTDESRQMILTYLGGRAMPFMAMVYPKDFEAKDSVTAYLDAYNAGKPLEERVIYTDLAGTVSMLTGGIMDGITIVLIAFAAISLVVSLIMIGIITYTSVLERTREIGILRALGARRKDVTRVFDAETFILGVFSGLIGVGVAYLLTLPINALLYRLTDLSGVANLPVPYALLLLCVSTILTVLGGHIPAKIASRKDAVEALRSE